MGAIDREIGGIFVPVSDIEAARDWYSELVGLVTDVEPALPY